MDTIDFKFSPNGYNHYILTIEGKEIGSVFEKEHAELIAAISSQKRMQKLEEELEAVKKEFSTYQHDQQTKEEAYKKTLKKIYTLTSGSAVPTIKMVNNLSSIIKLVSNEQTEKR